MLSIRTLDCLLDFRPSAVGRGSVGTDQLLYSCIAQASGGFNFRSSRWRGTAEIRASEAPDHFEEVTRLGEFGPNRERETRKRPPEVRRYFAETTRNRAILAVVGWLGEPSAAACWRREGCWGRTFSSEMADLQRFRRVAWAVAVGRLVTRSVKGRSGGACQREGSRAERPRQTERSPHAVLSAQS